MHETDFLVSLAQALVAALAGGFAARLLRLPMLVGYLLAGVVVGPYTPGLFANPETIHSVEKLGIALLMFAVGVHFSLRDLLAVKRIALIGGSIQIIGTILLGLALGSILGWGAYGGVFLGCALALSSTAVTLRIAEERGELGTAHGAVMTGILVVQDLSVVLMMAVLPALATFGSEGTAALSQLGVVLLKVVLFIGGMILIAVRLVPLLLDRVSRTNSQELFLLVVVCLCLSAAYLANEMGLSLEIGAFIAGMVISESEYSHEVFAEVRPLRDVFAALFFVSVGMLLNVSFVVQHWPTVLAVVLAIVVGKSLITFLAVYGLGAHGRTSLIAGLGLAQIGEFSFVLASMGSAKGLISQDLSNTLLASALVTILLAPFLYSFSSRLYAGLNSIPSISRFLNRPPQGELSPPQQQLADAKALILGSGRVGRYVSDALRAKGIPQIVVDYDSYATEQRRARGIPVIYGDATSEVVLKEALQPSLKLGVVALPETEMTQMAIRLVKKLAPDLRVIARVHRGAAIPHLREAGADMVFHAEFETATGMIRAGLSTLGVSEKEVEEYLEEVREDRYRVKG
jgi:CPA2 family monovalent cation:H+ antiporter-2